MARKVIVSVSIDTEADKDLLRWLDRQENRSAAIRAAIRDRAGRAGITLGDVYQAIKDLERKLGSGAALVGDPAQEAESWDEPPEAAAALDALGDL